MSRPYIYNKTEADKLNKKAAGHYLRGLHTRIDGMTQKRLADALGLEHYTFISACENGNCLSGDRIIG